MKDTRLNRCLIINFIAVLCAIGSASAEDLLLTCSTRGGDAYADGVPVADGECYALVHTADGATFRGFTADGRAVDPTKSYVALAAPLAEGGRCPPTLFQVLEENAKGRESGKWELFLVDTRRADGTPAGVDADGRPNRVNAWRRIGGKIRAKRGSLTFGGSVETGADTSAERLAGGAGAVPAEAPQPRITGIQMVDGTVELTVADTVPYLTYDIDGAAAPHDFGRKSRRMARMARDGRSGGEITLEVEPAALSGVDGARFFKVVRK